ncbi:MAG: HAD family phosphatase [Thermodesulfobacteriota bacterium]
MPSALAIRAIAFDLGNVLIKVDHLRFCRRLARLADRTPEEVYADVFATGLEPGYDTGRLSSREFYQRVISHFQVNLPYPQFCSWWNDIFDPMEGMAELIEDLKARYPLILVSNTNALHFPYICRRFPLVHHCRGFILSYRVGSRKPEAAIYQALIRETGRPPEQCLFIDDKSSFVEAAKTHGLTAWRFTSTQEFLQDLKRHDLW